MSDGSLDMDPEALLHIAFGVDTVAHRLGAVEPPAVDENPPASIVAWLDELPRLAGELHQVADVIRTVAGSVSVTEGEIWARFARGGDE
ncbi:hypothetical protein [Micromonospora lupini]|uniref:Uncharacterized protein n=1 Tax=Micromonospora lupini str. Lupac 08 TaxID=1150864 RepID=I0KZW7_9ACTN|nr:hypothetical protein [Micromonospora lupini]CCH17114.1 hypothetical protein MILUP08_42034 [Micromonospora lupini str. Lupac 08]